MAKTIYVNGTIYTMQKQSVQTEAVLVEHGKIIDVGSRNRLEKEAEKTIDLDGYTMLPAFIDAHSHLTGVANGFLQVDLSEIHSFADISEKIKDFIKWNAVADGNWVIAKGLNHTALQEKRMPQRIFLDEITDRHPLVLQHASGHVAACNTMGLRTLGITEQTENPAGGKISYDTGILEEMGWLTYMDRLPMPAMSELLAAFEKAQRLYASYGITTVQEGFFVSQIQDLYALLQQQDRLWLDVVAYMDLKNSPELIHAFPKSKGKYHQHFKVGGYKVLLDGSPQSKTAWMLEPYTDGSAGYPMLTDEALEQLIVHAVQEKQQLLMHANGDAAAQQYLRVYRTVKENMGAVPRPIMIHAQLAQPKQIAQMAELGITPSFFPAHVYHWGETHMENLGLARAQNISAMHTALEYGLPFTMHQDSPVLFPDMMEMLWCAVERRTKNDILLGGAQRLTPYEAIKAMTLHAAMQYGEEGEKGSIAKGKHADFVILDQDPMMLSQKALREIQVLATIKDGVVIYRR